MIHIHTSSSIRDMFLVFGVVVGDDDESNAVLVGTSDGVAVEGDNFVNAGVNDGIKIDDVGCVDECKSNDVWNICVVTDEDGAAAVDDCNTGNTAVVDTCVDCGNKVPICG